MTSNQLQYWRNVEQQRSNRAMEMENHRANVTRERETNRHQSEMERQNLLALNETQRSNRERERLTGQAQSEQRRANLAQEYLKSTANQIADRQVSLGYSTLGETSRHNQWQEVAGMKQAEAATAQAEAAAKNASTNRIGALNTIRHDAVTEQQRNWDLLFNGLGNAGRLLTGGKRNVK
nr:putative ORF1 [Marmot picobirnavirus]